MNKIGLFLALTILGLSVSSNGYCAEEGNVSESEASIKSAFNSFEKGDFSAAIKQYSQIVAKDPKNVNAYGGLGNCYFSKKDIPKAMEYFNKVIAIDPKNASALSGLGNCYLQTDPGKSKEYYKKAIAANAQNPWAYFNLGMLYSGEKNKNGALEQAKALAPLNKDLEAKLKKQIAIDNP